MTTTIDSAGRLVIPGPVRREAAIEPGVPLEVRWRDGVIEIEPLPAHVTFQRHGSLLVAHAKPAVGTLRRADVERTRENLATRRGRK